MRIKTNYCKFRAEEITSMIIQKMQSDARIPHRSENVLLMTCPRIQDTASAAVISTRPRKSSLNNDERTNGRVNGEDQPLVREQA